MGQCASTHSLYAVERPREERAVWRALLFPFEQIADGPQEVGPVWVQYPVEKVKACALIGLHMVIEENSGWSRRKAHLCRRAVRMKTTWCNGALFVIGLHGSGHTIALFLQDWEVAKVALSCHEAMDMLCQELHEVERRRGWFGF